MANDLDVIVQKVQAALNQVESGNGVDAILRYRDLCANHMPAILDALESARKALKPFVDDFLAEYGDCKNWRELNGELDLALDVQFKHWRAAVDAFTEPQPDPLVAEVERREGK